MARLYFQLKNFLFGLYCLNWVLIMINLNITTFSATLSGYFGWWATKSLIYPRRQFFALVHLDCGRFKKRKQLKTRHNHHVLRKYNIVLYWYIFLFFFFHFYFHWSGRIKHNEVCELLRQMLPPVGLGIKCPKTVAYKVFIIIICRFFILWV